MTVTSLLLHNSLDKNQMREGAHEKRTQTGEEIGKPQAKKESTGTNTPWEE